MSKIRFTLRYDKVGCTADSIKLKPTCQVPIELVYQISGKRGYHHFKKSIPAENWDAVTQRAVYYNPETRTSIKKLREVFPALDPAALLLEEQVKTINRTIENLDYNIRQIEKEFEAKGKDPWSKENPKGYNPKDVIERLDGRPMLAPTAVTAATKTIVGYIDDYIAWHEKQKDRVPGSLTIYRNVKRFLLDYQVNNGTVELNEINDEFFEKFRHYLNVEKKIGNVTVFKTLSSFKTLIKYAKSKGASIPDSYKEFKMKRDELEVISLTMDELKKIYALDLRNNKRLDGVRDCLVFSAATGLRWSDMNQLNRHHIKPNHIEISIKKTQMTKPLVIPLIPYSRAILEKYKGDVRPIPIISNVKMNLYLKEIGELAEMNESIEIVRYRGNRPVKTHHLKKELLTCHVGRKTFATLHLELGMPAEVVMALGGWTDHRSFARYVHISDQRKASLMTDAWEKVIKPKSKKKPKPVNRLKAV